tara:strand:- start:638 stop:1543 length:906 start_codon:yes stop_codon:yes gene_type:complete
MNIKEQLTKICEDIVEENNKILDQEEYKNTGISNHIFDEKGVQMKIGLELINKLKLDNKLQFERKVFNENHQKKDYLDVFLFHNNKKIGIELKFKTKGIKKNLQKDFNYYFSNQGAGTIGQHSFFWDLHRLNDLVDREEIHQGYQIFITNDCSYWIKKEKKEKTTNKFIIKIDKELKGNTEEITPYISNKEEPNNSHTFNMSQGTLLIKKGMNPPNWLSIDNIQGQKDKDPHTALSKNLKKKLNEGKLLYSTQEIKLEHVVDEHILWKPELAKKMIKSSKNSKTKKVSKFAFIIVELKKEK